MKFVLSLLIVSTLSAASLVPAAFGQASADSAARATREQTIRQALIQKIEQAKYQKLKDALALDDATAQKFFSIYKPAEQDIQSLVKQRNDAMKALAEATQNGATDAQLATLAQNVRSLNEQISSREHKLDQDLKPVLTPAQQAKLLVFEHQFNQRVRQELASRQAQNERAQLRALRQQLRRQRIKNQLLKKKTAAKSGSQR